MADYQFSTGEGIAFSGKAQTFEGLHSRMLGMEQEKRKAQDKGIATLNDFSVGTGKYLPFYAQKIAQEKMNFINDLQKDIKQYGKAQAINRNWMRKQEVVNAIKRHEMSNDNAVKMLAVDGKSYNPRAEKMLSVLSNPNATDEEFMALNDPDAGVMVDSGYNLTGRRFPKADENALLKDFKDDFKPFVEDVKDINGNITAVKIGSRISEEQKPIIKEYIAGNQDLITQWFFQNEENYRKKGINPFSQDDAQRIKAKEQIAEDIFNAKLGERSQMQLRSIPQEQAWRAKERKESTPIVEGNTVTYKGYRWNKSKSKSGEDVYSFSPVNKDMPKFDLMYENEYIIDDGIKRDVIKRGNERYYKKGTKEYPVNDKQEIKAETKQLVNVTSAQITKKGNEYEMVINIIDDKKKGTTRPLVIKGKYGDANNISTISAITGLTPEEVDNLLKGGTGRVTKTEPQGKSSAKKWTYNGKTLTQEEWINKHGWTLDDLNEFAKPE